MVTRAVGQRQTWKNKSFETQLIAPVDCTWNEKRIKTVCLFLCFGLRHLGRTEKVGTG